MLRAEGLKPVARRVGKVDADEVSLVVMPPSDMLPALAAGSISGYIVAEPFNAAAELMGVGKVLRFTGDVWRNHACCTVFMHERDLNGRPQWSQGVVDAIVRAQLWILENRAEAAKILARESGKQYTPHGLAALTKVLAPPASDTQSYLASRAIRHGDWKEERIGFQPYPYPSYTEELVTRLKNTVVEAERGFLNGLDPVFAAKDLVDDRFVKKSIEAVGGLKKFGAEGSYSRQEIIDLTKA